jgi:hypothetical protein
VIFVLQLRIKAAGEFARLARQKRNKNKEENESETR